jgi:hypothetical protein
MFALHKLNSSGFESSWVRIPLAFSVQQQSQSSSGVQDFFQNIGISIGLVLRFYVDVQNVEKNDLKYQSLLTPHDSPRRF